MKDENNDDEGDGDNMTIMIRGNVSDEDQDESNDDEG